MNTRLNTRIEALEHSLLKVRDLCEEILAPALGTVWGDASFVAICRTTSLDVTKDIILQTAGRILNHNFSGRSLTTRLVRVSAT